VDAIETIRESVRELSDVLLTLNGTPTPRTRLSAARILERQVEDLTGAAQLLRAW
jgi:hypothetical protein